MEQDTQKRLDSVLEDEIRAGYRVKDVPPNLTELLVANGGPAIRRVRFSRLNPARRRKISEAVQRQYHKDLRNPDILSHEQILKLVEERGEWTKAMDEEMTALREDTSREMGALYANGLLNDDWGVELIDLSSAFRARLKELVTVADDVVALLKVFDRWVEYAPSKQADYDKQHASAQGRETYSVDVDQQRLLTTIAGDPAASETIYQIDDLRDRMARFLKLQRDRLRLAEMQLKQFKIFSDSVEQRRDNTDEMARLYFTTEQIDEAGTPLGPLTPTFEALWDLPEDAVQWFLLEAYFFQNGIPDSAREYLESFGFLKADRADETNPSPAGDSAPFDGLLDPQSSSSDSAAPVETEGASLEPRVPTISTTAS